jgi:hypothetical protein
MKKPLTDIVVNGGERWFTAKIRLQNVNVRSCGIPDLHMKVGERQVLVFIPLRLPHQ